MGDLTIEDSALYGNTSSGVGGAILNNLSTATLRVINSTVSGNTAATRGGGIDNFLGELPCATAPSPTTPRLPTAAAVFTTTASTPLVT